MRYLLNSAVLGNGAWGTYSYAPATLDDLRGWLAEGDVVSLIGYRETAEYVERVTGWLPPLSRESMVLAPGDEAIVVRLRYRVADPATKGRPLGVRDDEWEISYLRRLGGV